MQKNKNDNSKNNSENKKDELEEFLDKIPDESFDDIRNVDYHEDFDSFKEVKLHTGLSGLKYLFTASVPDSPHFPKEELERHSLLIPMAFIYFLVYLIALSYFTYSGALDESNKTFLSIEKSNNVDVSCDEIPLSVTGTLSFDLSGNWQTESTFLSNETIFSLTLSGSSITTDYYKKAFAMFKEDISKVGIKGSQRDIAWNLVALSSYRSYDDVGNMMLTPSTNAGVAYDNVVFTTSIVSRQLGMCREELQIFGSYENNFLKIHIPANLTEADYYNYPPGFNPSCKEYLSESMIPPYKIWSERDIFKIKYDIRSIITILAVNLGILDVKFLVTTESAYQGLVDLPAGNFYVDPYYSGMLPIYCLDQQDSLCFYLDGGYEASRTIYYPWTNSINYANYDGAGCSCPFAATSEACNTLDIGFILFMDNDNNQTLAALNTIEMGRYIQSIITLDPEYGDLDVSKLLYPLMTAIIKLSIDVTNDTKNDAIISILDSICTSSTCGAVFAEISGYSFFLPVNSANFQLISFTDYEFDVTPSASNGYSTTAPQIACTDYINLKAPLDIASSKTPTTLVAGYYKCHSNFLYALKNSIGNASGSASLACAIVIPLLTFILGIAYNLMNRNKRKLYYLSEKNLLDSMVTTRSKHALNKIIEGLCDELAVVKNEIVDYRLIFSKLITMIPASEAKQLGEILKKHSVPDSALQQELLAFKRYYIHEKKENILDDKNKSTGRAGLIYKLPQETIQKANTLQQTLDDNLAKKRIKKKNYIKDNDMQNIVEKTLEKIQNEKSQKDASLSQSMNDSLSQLSMGVLSWNMMNDSMNFVKVSNNDNNNSNDNTVKTPEKSAPRGKKTPESKS